jgi:hypothetical protein
MYVSSSFAGSASLARNIRLYSKSNPSTKGWGQSQVVERLPASMKPLVQTPSTAPPTKRMDNTTGVQGISRVGEGSLKLYLHSPLYKTEKIIQNYQWQIMERL